MDPARLRQVAQRFPLVPRSRPPCPPLTERVSELTYLAHEADRDGNLSLAAAVQNKASLIASDCGLPDLARSLCWRHHEAYQHARPLTAQAARHALEPLVNLARLHIRNGDGEAAYQLLAALFHAVKYRAVAVIDGNLMSFEDFAASQEDHGQLRQWLWTILLSDGTRALIRTGQWERAQKHAANLRGVGKRLLDGRQVDVIALCLQGKAHTALKSLEESVTLEEWEDAIAACISVLCLHSSNQPDARTTASMMRRYLALDSSPELAMFHVRVGLTAYDLSVDISQDQAAQIHRRLTHAALESRDGYVAHEILSHQECRERLSARQEQTLSIITQSAGLYLGALPKEAKRQLLEAAATGERITRSAQQHVGSKDPRISA